MSPRRPRRARSRRRWPTFALPRTLHPLWSLLVLAGALLAGAANPPAAVASAGALLFVTVLGLVVACLRIPCKRRCRPLQDIGIVAGRAERPGRSVHHRGEQPCAHATHCAGRGG